MKIAFEITRSSDSRPSNKDDVARKAAFVETARKEIDGLRAEINVRVQQRDLAITGYLAASAAIAAAAVKDGQSLEMLLIVPTLSPAVAAIVAQHHVVIGRREALIKKKLRPLLVSLGAAAPHVEPGRNEMDRRELWTRTLAHVISLFVPAVLALIMNRQVLSECSPGLLSAWIAALLGTVVAAYFSLSSYRIRQGFLKPDESEAPKAGP